MNTVSSFGSSGGLGEAAAWLCLREDIHVSLISQKPLRTNLESFHHSDIFLRNDDFAWAARMVFLLAKVLKCAFNQMSSPEYTALQSIAQEVEDWNSRKPPSFQPLRELPRGKNVSRRFPEMWMLLPVHGEYSDICLLSTNVFLSGRNSVLPYRQDSSCLCLLPKSSACLREFQKFAKHRGTLV